MLKSSIRRAGSAALVLCCLAALLTGCFLFPNRPPVASFVVQYNVDLEDAMVVDLDASTSSDPDGDAITSYMWTFGDHLVTIMSPLAETATVSFPVLRVRYPNEDEFTIQLLVIDERGAPSEIVTETITLPNIQVDPTQ